MVRVVLGPGGRLVVDRKGQGRGAWLCRLGEAELAEPECIGKAGRRGAFSRALRADIRAGEVELLLATVSGRARMGRESVPPREVPASRTNTSNTKSTENEVKD